MRRFFDALVKPLTVTTARAWFWVWRWIKNGGSMSLRAVPTVDDQRPVAHLVERLSLLVAARLYDAYRGIRQFGLLWQKEYADYALAHYAKRLSKHYSGLGLAYRQLREIGDGERHACFHDNSSSRLAPFIDAHPTVLDYRDGESFLDAGCGQGPEIKELTARFPHSPVRGIDLNESAIAVVRAGTRGNPLVSAEVGDITDLA